MPSIIEADHKGPPPQDMISLFARRLYGPQGRIAQSMILQADPTNPAVMAGYHLGIKPSKNQNPRGPYTPSGDILRAIAEQNAAQGGQ